MRVDWRPLALLVVSACSAAQESLTFNEAAQKTLANRPEFRVLASRMTALNAQRDQAALKPGYELDVELENVLGTGGVSSIGGAELSVSLSRVWERGGKRAARMGVVDSNADLLSADRRVVALDLVAETARQFVALAVAQQSIADAQAAKQQAQQTVELTKRRFAVAQAPEIEVLNSELALSDITLAEGNARRALAQAQQLLGAQWGEPGALLVAELDIYALERPMDTEVLLARLEQTPELQRYASETRVAQAELALARTQARADFTFSAGVRRLEDLDAQALLFGFSMPLDAARRAQPFIAERSAQLERVDAEQAVTRLRLQVLLRQQLLTLQNAYAAEQAVREQQLAPAQRVVELTRRGFSIGRFPYRELASAERQLLELKRKRLEAAAAYRLTRVEIERLTGVLPVIEPSSVITTPAPTSSEPLQ